MSQLVYDWIDNDTTLIVSINGGDSVADNRGRQEDRLVRAIKKLGFYCDDLCEGTYEIYSNVNTQTFSITYLTPSEKNLVDQLLIALGWTQGTIYN